MHLMSPYMQSSILRYVVKFNTMSFTIYGKFDVSIYRKIRYDTQHYVVWIHNLSFVNPANYMATRAVLQPIALWSAHGVFRSLSQPAHQPGLDCFVRKWPAIDMRVLVRSRLFFFFSVLSCFSFFVSFSSGNPLPGIKFMCWQFLVCVVHNYQTVSGTRYALPGILRRIRSPPTHIYTNKTNYQKVRSYHGLSVHASLQWCRTPRIGVQYITHHPLIYLAARRCFSWLMNSISNRRFCHHCPDIHTVRSHFCFSFRWSGRRLLHQTTY